MAIRVTADEVKEIMDGCTLTDAIIDAFIESASLVIDNGYVGISISDGTLKVLEKWLTAHMIASTVFRTAAEEEVDNVKIKYTGKWGEKLLSTPYGQMLTILDPTGTILQLAKQKAFIKAIKSFE
jgi:hypothetical protein